MMYCVRLFFVVSLLGVMVSNTTMAQPAEYRVVGFYLSYNIYDAEYFVDDIPADQLTHLVYGHMAISENGQCESSDSYADRQFKYPGDSDTERLRGNFKQLQLLREDYPELQIIMSIGGWDFSEGFSDAARTQAGRTRLVRSCVAFMRQYDFDGIDIDWRYPVVGGAEDTPGTPDDSRNLTSLVTEFRSNLDYWNERDDKPYLLTMTSPAIKSAYSEIELGVLQAEVDWFNVTTYGFSGSWSDLTSHHAPLYSNPQDPRFEDVREGFTVDAVINDYLDAGVSAEKINMGIPLYAQVWANVQDNDFFGIFQTTNGIPMGTRPGGILHYGDLNPLLQDAEYISYFDDIAKAPWLYNPNDRIAISYENLRSAQHKITYVRRNSLGGIMLWELSFDDNQHTFVQSLVEDLQRDN